MDIVNKFNVNSKQVTLDVIYDVTANNSSVTFESLQSLLSSSNLSMLIPESVRYGGMSIRFVQSSDHKYVQYRLMSDSFNTSVSNWQGIIMTEQSTRDGSIVITDRNITIADAVSNLNYVEIQGSWKTLFEPCVLLPNTVYVFKMIHNVESISNSPIIDLEFKDKDGQAVTCQGFSPLSNVGDSCEITVSRKTATWSIYVNGNLSRASIEKKVSTTEEISALQNEVSKLFDEGYIFAGVANTSTNPGTPTSKVFWISYGIGVHQYFGNYDAKSPLTIFYWYNNSSWAIEDIGGNLSYNGTPFVADRGIQLKQDNANAVRDINIYTDDLTIAKMDFELRYLWKNVGSNNNSYIEIFADGVSFKSWSVNNYTPLDSVEDIVLWKKDGTYIVVTIDWSKLTDGVQFDGYIPIKMDRVHIVKNNGVSYNSNSISISRTIYNAVLKAYIIPEFVYDLTSKYYISYFWKNYGDSNATFVQIKKTTLDNVTSVVAEKIFTVPVIGKQKIEFKDKAVIYIDWDSVPNGFYTESAGVEITGRYEIPADEANDGYAIKDTTKNQIIVDKTGTINGAYSTITDACAAVVNSSHQNQYEIFVNPGIYTESNIVVPHILI